MPSPGGQGPDSIDTPFTEIQVSNGNRSVHLLRFNTLDAETQDSANHRRPGSHHSDQSDDSPRGSNLLPTESPQINLHLPGGSLNGAKVQSKKIHCLGDEAGIELEMERAEFDDNVPRFRNNFGFERMSLREKEGVPLPDTEDEFVAEYNRRSAPKQNGGVRKSNNLSSPLLYNSEAIGSGGANNVVKPIALAAKQVSPTGSKDSSGDNARLSNLESACSLQVIF